MIDYATIKIYVQSLYGLYVGSGLLIEDTAGSPTTLAVMLDLVNNRIAGYPREFGFQKKIGTITLTGAQTYDLSVLFPDLLSVYQIYGISEFQESDYVPNYVGNIQPLNGAFTLRGKILDFGSSSPTSGVAKIQYKSQYMVEDSSGTRKKFFTDDSDVSVLDEVDINALIGGLGQFVAWKTDATSQEQKEFVKGIYKEAWENLWLRNDATSQVHSLQ